LPDQADLVVDVERAIGRALDRGQSPEVGVIAAQLAMSERTLQRRLGERSTKFAEVVDRVRRSWAERYLADDRLAIGEIAFLLGYGDVSNFHRAFRRWTGLTPAGFRDAQRAGAR
jgi:AraC-like DNA-binding protein